jgi:hypothetical protein
MTTINRGYLQDRHNWGNIRLTDLESFMQRNGFEFHSQAIHCDHWIDKISSAVVKVHAPHSQRNSGHNGFATRWSTINLLNAFEYRERFQEAAQRARKPTKPTAIEVRDIPPHLATTFAAVRDGKNYTLFYKSYPEFKRTFFVANGNAHSLMNDAGEFLHTTYSAAINAIQEKEAELKTKYNLDIAHTAEGIIFTSPTLRLCEIVVPGTSTTDALANIETQIQEIIDKHFSMLSDLENMDFRVDHKGNTLTISHPRDPENEEWTIACDAETFLIPADDFLFLQELKEWTETNLQQPTVAPLAVVAAQETQNQNSNSEPLFEKTAAGILAELMDRRRDLTPRKLAAKILKTLTEQLNVEITGKQVESWATGADYPTPDTLDALISALNIKTEKEIEKYRTAYYALQEWFELPPKNRTTERPQDFTLQTLLYVLESPKSFEDFTADITKNYTRIPTETRVDIDFRLVSRMLANRQKISEPLAALTVRTLRNTPVMERERFASRELMLRQFYTAATDCVNGRHHSQPETHCTSTALVGSQAQVLANNLR